MSIDQTLLTAVFHHIDHHEQNYLDRLIEYLRQPSISAHGQGIAEVGEILLAWLQNLGFTAELKPTAGWPMVLGRRIEDPNLPTVMLYGHYDVQPPDPLALWDSPPFEPTIRNGRLYARGVGDNKGQHTAHLFAMESLLATHGKLPCNVIFLLEGEEEIGSPHIAQFIADYKDELNADLVIISDGPVDHSGQSTIEFGVRGVVSFDLRAQGASQDLHSGNWGGVVPNPLWTLVHLLATMKNERGEITIDGLYDHVEPPSPLEREALDNLPVDVAGVMAELQLSRLDAPEERPFFDRLSVWPTLTINGLHGGYGGPGSKTVLPCQAIAKCDIRLVPNQTVADIMDKVEAHVKRHAPEVEFVRLGGMDPSKTPLDSPFTTPIRAAIVAAQGKEPLLMPAMGGSLPNYVFTKTLGLHTFVIPYANADESNHAPNENMEVWRIKQGIRTSASLLLHLAQHQ
jgi:acetylornithine deacetylase/succinyl-diaminopimelate desuccinylase-like protein